MPKYEVIEGISVFDEFREAGTLLEIDEASAFPLVESGNLKLVEEPTPDTSTPTERPAQSEGSADAPATPEGGEPVPSNETPSGVLQSPPEVPVQTEAPASENEVPSTPAPAPAPVKSGWVGGHTV